MPIQLRLVLPCLAVLMSLAPVAQAAQPGQICATPLADSAIEKIFRQNLLNQLAMEFGKQHLALDDISQSPVSADLVRVEAEAQHRRPGSVEPTRTRVVGWVSRCLGTTLVRNQTWLADGTLSVPRFTAAQLSGQGITIGKPDAPIQLIAFVDSRCPNCHRLISYAMALAKTGKLYLELRQVAYLETVDEALRDARLFETRLVQGDQASLDDTGYLEYLGGFASDEETDKQAGVYKTAANILKNNTRIARTILHISAVPGVLLQEKDRENTWRLLGYWELNRMMQPDL